jgi:hypothetical protein
MGLTGTGNALGTAIWNALKALSWIDDSKLSGAEQANIIEAWQTIATQIVNHIISESDVPVLPGTFAVSHDGSRPVAGQGEGSIT